MDVNSAARRQLIATISSSQEDATAQALLAWRQLARELCPLIGDTGYCALFGRTLRLLPSADGILAAPFPPCPDPEAVVTALGAAYAQADGADVHKTNIVLLETFTQLLSGLIGETLTVRLLNSAWLSASEQKDHRSPSR